MWGADEVPSSADQISRDRSRACKGVAATGSVPTCAHARALVQEGGVGDRPAVVEVADTSVVVDNRIADEDLAEPGTSRHLPQRSDFDTRLDHVEPEPGDASVLGHVGVRTSKEH